MRALEVSAALWKMLNSLDAHAGYCTSKKRSVKTSSGLFLRQMFTLPYAEWLRRAHALCFRKRRQSIVFFTPVCRTLSPSEPAHADISTGLEHLCTNDWRFPPTWNVFKEKATSQNTLGFHFFLTSTI